MELVDARETAALSRPPPDAAASWRATSGMPLLLPRAARWLAGAALALAAGLGLKLDGKG